jgi:hypothetical protein
VTEPQTEFAANLELLQKCFRAIAEIYTPGAVAWAEEVPALREELRELEAEVSARVFETPPSEYRELLKRLYFLWKNKVLPEYRRAVAEQKIELVEEAFAGERMAQSVR